VNKASTGWLALEPESISNCYGWQATSRNYPSLCNDEEASAAWSGAGRARKAAPKSSSAEVL
jgi:hypothetical protein